MPETFSTSLTISLQLFVSGVGDAALNLVSRSKNDGIVVWRYAHMENPPEIGYFGVKLRKQIREEEIIAMIPRRMGWARNPPDDIQ